jgi:hypothetical protein
MRGLASLALLVSSVLATASIAVAQPPDALVIHRTALDADTGVLTITGTGLGPELTVLLEGQPVAVLPGATGTRIEVQVPAAALATPGASRLVVLDPTRRLGDAFVVAGATSGAIQTGAIDATTSAPTADPARVSGEPASDDPPRSASTSGAADPKMSRPAPNLVEHGNYTAVGLGALVSNSPTVGVANTAVGYNAMYYNATGTWNTAVGHEALVFNTQGQGNTAIGNAALYGNSGHSNTAVGRYALFSNTSASGNTATGGTALYSNTTGILNTADGHSALLSNTTGSWNTANGYSALHNNTTGDDNTASGDEALRFNTTGNGNTGVGASALRAANGGDRNVGVGSNAGADATTGSFNIYLGAEVRGTASDANTIRLGSPYGTGGAGFGQNRTFIAGIHGTQLTGPAVPVFIDANGQLGTLYPPLVSGPIDAPVSLPPSPPDQQALIVELRERVARLEALVQALTRRR